MAFCHFSPEDATGGCEIFCSSRVEDAAIVRFVPGDCSDVFCIDLLNDPRHAPGICGSIASAPQGSDVSRLSCCGCCVPAGSEFFPQIPAECGDLCFNAHPSRCEFFGGRFMEERCSSSTINEFPCFLVSPCSNKVACCTTESDGITLRPCEDRTYPDCTQQGGHVAPVARGKADGRCRNWSEPGPCGTACCIADGFEFGCTIAENRVCADRGGTPVGDEHQLVAEFVACTENTCAGGCCMCDWCCNIPAEDCEKHGGKPFGERCETVFSCADLRRVPECKTMQYAVDGRSQFVANLIVPTTTHQARARFGASCNHQDGAFVIEENETLTKVQTCITDRRFFGQPVTEKYIGYAAIFEDDAPLTKFETEVVPLCPPRPEPCEIG